MDPKAHPKTAALQQQLEHLTFAVELLGQAGVPAEQSQPLTDAANAAQATASEAFKALEKAEKAKKDKSQKRLLKEADKLLATAMPAALAAEADLYQALRSNRTAGKATLREGAPVAISVDLGGTKILAAAVDKSGNILARKKLKTGRGTPEAIIGRVARAVTGALKLVGASEKQCRGIGIGAPGSIDYEKGEVVLAPNLDWEHVPVRDDLAAALKLDCPIHLENDVNLGTLGEARYGIARGLADVVGIFWGTGIGGGVISGGQRVHGADGMAAEIGHLILEAGGPLCGCGNYGCLEALASRTAIARDLRKAVARGEDTVWRDASEEDLDTVRSGLLSEAFAGGDRVTRQILLRSAWQIGIVSASVANLLAPRVVIAGGGVMEAMETELLPAIRQAFRMHLFSAASRSILVVPSLLADDAGILGGAALVWEGGK